MMLIQELLHRAFSSKRIFIVQSEAGYQLIVSYFGVRFSLAAITVEEVKGMQRTNLQAVQ